MFMMITLMMCIVKVSFGQVKTIHLSKVELTNLNCDFYEKINLSTSDTSYVLSLGFQNAQYKYIDDFQSINFFCSEDLKEFINDVKAISGEVGNKTNVAFNKSKYRLSVFDFDDVLILTNPQKNGYCNILKKEVDVFSFFLEGVKLPTKEVALQHIKKTILIGN